MTCRGLIAAAILTFAGAPAWAQVCPPPRGRLLLAVSAARVRGAGPVPSGRLLGGETVWAASRNLSVRVRYQHLELPGSSLHGAGPGAAARLPGPGTICLSADVVGSVGSGLNAGDSHRNLTIPVRLVVLGARRRPPAGESRAGPARSSVTPFLGAEFLPSATDSRLLGERVRTQVLGYGALAGARLELGRALAEVVLGANTLGSAIGPHILGRARAEASFGFAF